MLFFFPRDVLDEIWDLIESVSEGFPTYLLANLSRRLPGSLLDRQLSVVVVVCCMTSTLSNDISSETTGPFKPKFYLWQPWTGGLKVCFCL